MYNGGSNSGGNAGLSFGKGSNPPNLADYSDNPKYDLTTVVQIVRVRPMILWGWEQQLGIPSPMRVPDESGGNGRRYSERDIVASLWLREQILNGVSPNEAAARLLGPHGTGRVNTGSLSGSGSLSGPLDDGLRSRGNMASAGESGSSGFMARSAKPTRRLSELEQSPNSGPLSPTLDIPSSGQLYSPQYPTTSGPLGSSYPSSSGSGRLPGGMYSSPLSGPAVGPGSLHPAAPGSNSSSLGKMPLSGQLAEPKVASFTHHESPNSGTLEPIRQTAEATAPGVPWSGPGAPEKRGRDLRSLQPQFIRAFTSFDTPAANYILNEALGSRSVETVCIGLLLPTLSRISDLTSKHEASTPEERFAVNYAKSFLFAIFHRTPERNDGPLAFVGCGPKELSEVNALTLAVFWRRAGLRVIYLGQDIEADSLVQEVRKRRPALVCLTVTTAQRIRSLARLAKALNQLDAPRPFVGFSGPAFMRNPELQRKVTGVYLGDDAATATWHVSNLLGADRGAAAPA
ncbi:MAG: MerR family transcriptional regulator [Ktedonobacterales bacterium]